MRSSGNSNTCSKNPPKLDSTKSSFRRHFIGITTSWVSDTWIIAEGTSENPATFLFSAIQWKKHINLQFYLHLVKRFVKLLRKTSWNCLKRTINETCTSCLRGFTNYFYVTIDVSGNIRSRRHQKPRISYKTISHLDSLRIYLSSEKLTFAHKVKKPSVNIAFSRAANNTKKINSHLNAKILIFTVTGQKYYDVNDV